MLRNLLLSNTRACKCKEPTICKGLHLIDMPYKTTTINKQGTLKSKCLGDIELTGRAVVCDHKPKNTKKNIGYWLRYTSVQIKYKNDNAKPEITHLGPVMEGKGDKKTEELTTGRALRKA